MCGISFVLNSGSYCTNSDDFFKDSLITNQVRGTDSTGVFQLTAGGLIRGFKKAENASSFVDWAEAKTIIRDVPRSPLTVGHVRHATMGSIKEENAHPFIVTRADGTKVVGVHNGTLRGWKNKAGSKDIDVDSAWAFAKLAEEGPIDAFEYFAGAFAFVWYDEQHPGHVFMARNEDRPLHFMLADDGKTMLGASELGMLGWLADRHRFKLSTREGGGLYYIEPNRIYKFSLKDIGKFTEYDMPKYDPHTTIYAPTPAVSTLPVPTPYNSPTTSYRSSHTGPTTPSYMELKLEAVKEALRAARKSLNSSPITNEADAVTAEDMDSSDQLLENMVRREVAKISRHEDSRVLRAVDVWQLADTELFETMVDEDKATIAEVNGAKGMKVFGRMVPFVPVMWDDDNKELLGEVAIMIGNQAVEFTGVVRGLTKSVAEEVYIKSLSPFPMTITGWVMENNGVDIVVSNISPAGRSKLLSDVPIASVN